MVEIFNQARIYEDISLSFCIYYYALLCVKDISNIDSKIYYKFNFMVEILE